jgi:nicotinate-nucleotide pyrophosphorylase (carboxylating)
MTIEHDLRTRVGADARRLADLALAEDGPRDITTEAAIAPGTDATGAIEARSACVLAGTTYADAVTMACDLSPVTWTVSPGAQVEAGTTVGLMRGPMAAILRAERPLLNLLQRACGIATATRAYVEAVAGTHARILHTRKTAPGLRLLDVTSVLAGGGVAHRLELGEAVLVKDNHWRALERSGRSLAEVLAEARAHGTGDCYVEVESQEMVRQATEAGATRLLIDNQTPATVRQWGDLARGLRRGIEIEATGGITLAQVRAYAEAGADYISIGALTHSVQAADLALEIRETG